MREKRTAKRRGDGEENLPAATGEGSAAEIDPGTQGGEPSGPSSGAGVDRDLREALDRLETDVRAAEDKYLRALAELDNMRKRMAREKSEWLQYGHEPVARDLLPILDNLDRALGAASEVLRESDEESAAKALVEGVELTLRQFQDALARHGVTPVESLGKPFDPNFHEAVQRVVRDDVPPGTVVIEFQKGYMLHDRLLRAAQVAVSMEPPEIDGEVGS
jgi:molecular chaperone GrpE